MHVMFFAQHYAPEEVSGAVLATELAADLAAWGHQVSFVTSAPNYPNGIVFEGYRNALVANTEARDGVQVTRVWSHISPDRSFAARAANHATFSGMALFGGLAARHRGGMPDVLFSFSPPLPLGISAWLLSRAWRVPWVLRVEDLYPDAAIAAGALNNPTAIGFFTRLERFIYRRAGHISLISEGFRRNLLAKGVPPEKLSVTPVWADPDIVRPLPKENAFRAENGLEGRFVVMYAGNLGHAAATEDIIAAAALLREDPDIRFVLVGEGARKQALQARTAELGLTNVLFLPYQPRERFPEVAAAADVSLVTLNARSAAFSMPSKTFSVLASARPILAVAPEESEVTSLVREAECGVSVPPGEIERLADAILSLKVNVQQRAEMGYNGRKLLEAQFSRRRCVASFEHLLNTVAAAPAQ